MTNLKKNYPRKSSDVPATRAMLYLVRDGLEATAQKNFRVLKQDISELKLNDGALRAEFKSDLAELRAEFKSDLAELRAEFKSDLAELRAEFKSDLAALRTEIKSDIKNLENQIVDLKDFIKSEMHQMKLLIEEQNARNIFVLDGLTNLFDRQDRLEKRVEKLEKGV